MNVDTNHHDPEIRHHRNRLAGLWAAELLGLIGKAAHDYAHDLGNHGADEQIEAKLAGDLKGHFSLAQVREKLVHLAEEARRQVLRRD